MRAIIHKLVTDSDGESIISFKVPFSDLPNVVKLNLLIGKEIELITKEKSNGNSTGAGK